MIDHRSYTQLYAVISSCETLASFTFYGYIMNSQSDLLPHGLTAQLVGHCTSITEVISSSPIQT